MENEKKLQLGYKLKYIRHCVAYSKEKMGALLSVDASRLAEYEDGESKPYDLITYKIAKLFHIEYEDLVNEAYSVDDFAVKYNESHFRDCPYSNLNYDE